MIETFTDVFSIAHPKEFYIDGQWVKPLGSHNLEIVYAATETVVARPPEASVEDVNRAIAAAKKAFETGPWARMSFDERAEKLFKVAEIMQRRAGDFAKSWTLEGGAASSLAGPASYAGFAFFSYYANLIKNRTFEEIRPQSMGEGVGIIVKEPVGVVAAIVPWNAPLALAAKIIAPALAAGCSVILKPPPETPLFAWQIAECIEEAGLPPGVFNFVPAGREIGETLVRSPDVDKVCFVGSTAAGRRIAQLCGERLGRVSLELGGKSPAIVLDDIDPAAVMPNLVPYFTIHGGQGCGCLTRILVPAKRHDEYADAIATSLRHMKVGDPFDPQNFYGPLAMKRQYDKVMNYFRIGREEGAKVIAGGGRPAGLDVGYYVEPTLFSARNDMVIAREEIFGPAAVLIPYDGEEEAIRLANDTDYGLNGAVYTNDAEAAYRIGRRIRAGNFTHNGCANDLAFPFGGFKNSGIGRDGGPEGLALMQETKVVFMKEPPPSLANARP